ncbi:MAG: hypothetical protein HY718_13535 [Planctomycetes bacterium]|nr:hypothetical protein [Planctomycetota bacterium]
MAWLGDQVPRRKAARAAKGPSPAGRDISGLVVAVFKKLLYNDEEQIRPVIVYGLAALAIGVGGYFVYARWAGTDRPVEVSLLCATAGCGYSDERQLQIGEPIPGICPTCKQASVYPAFRCPKCRTANVLNEDRGIKGRTKCSKCGAELHYGG